MTRKRRILITGFGPFHGAPHNPSNALARGLAKLRRPVFYNAVRTSHVFDTCYASVDRDLRDLLARERPDILLMFGVATRSKRLRIEMRARNATASFADISGYNPAARSIERGETSLRARLPAARLVHALRRAGIPAAPSRNAGRYLCNYLYWHALKAIRRPGGPLLVLFVHVPPLQGACNARGRRWPAQHDLLRAGEIILRVLLALR